MVALNYLKNSNPNFSMDADGEPISTAPGGKPDIELEYEGFKLMIEVTLSVGDTQYNMEGESVTRHYGKERKTTDKDLYCLFVAPRISESCAQYYLVSNKTSFKANGGKQGLLVYQPKIIEFIRAGIENNFSNPNSLEDGLIGAIQNAKKLKMRLSWVIVVEQSCAKWAV
jgi:hypothetical protein